MNKKREGSVLDVLSVMVAVVASAVIMMAYLNIMQLHELKDSVSQLSRHYILRMETFGYLTAADRTQLLRELQELGATEVDLSGTTTTDVGYGNPVYLDIRCNLHAEDLVTGDLFRLYFQDKGFPVNEKRMSTAKN